MRHKTERETAKPSRTYKDSVFTSYFGEDSSRLVEVYNAIEGTDYPLDTPVEQNTLDNALYKGKMNDISFTLDGKVLVLIEHQSTINNNMAVRMLMYIGRLYEKVINQKDKYAVYREERMKIPRPKFVVLYNGLDEYPEHSVQYLSEAFEVTQEVKQENPDLELKIDIYNINYGKSVELLEKSNSLYEYSYFIQKVRDYRMAYGYTTEEAVDKAIADCIKEDVMTDYLLNHGVEVTNMLFAEWNQDDANKYYEERGLAKGIEKGITYGEQQKERELIRAFATKLSPQEIAEIVKQPLEYVLEVLTEESEHVEHV